MDRPTNIETLEREGRELYAQMRPYRVSAPCGARGPWTIAPYDTEFGVTYLWESRDGRPPGIGRHTRLVHEDYGVVMSDTAPEIIDLLRYIGEMRGRILISGLGLGMALHILTQIDAYSRHVQAITVVEKDSDVVALVAPHYRALDRRIEIVNADTLAWTPPQGAAWDVAWHDIWPDISLHNLPEMDALRSRYAPYVPEGRQFLWGEAETRAKQNWTDPVT